MLCFNCLPDVVWLCFVALPHDAVDLSAEVSVVFPVYTHLLFAYLVFSCIMNGPIIALF